jgi:hypothetical protein
MNHSAESAKIIPYRRKVMNEIEIELGVVLPAIKLAQPVTDYRIYGDAVRGEWEPIPPANMRIMAMMDVLTDTFERIDPSTIDNYGPVPNEHLFMEENTAELQQVEEVETSLPDITEFKSSQSL